MILALGIVEPDFDLWYVGDGRGAVRVNGRWHDVRANELVLMKPGDRYEQERTTIRDPYTVYFMHFFPFGRDDPELDQAFARDWPDVVDLPLSSSVGSLFAGLARLTSDHSYGWSLRMKLRVLEIIHEVAGYLNARNLTDGSGSASLFSIARARRLIEPRFAEDLMLSEIAEEVGLSSSHLSTMFRIHVGRPPIEYQTECRLNEAKHLLSTGHNVSETSDRVGYHSIHYFSRTFKKHLGLSPSEYRRAFPSEDF